jgi:hypothetical protein
MSTSRFAVTVHPAPQTGTLSGSSGESPSTGRGSWDIPCDPRPTTRGTADAVAVPASHRASSALSEGGTRPGGDVRSHNRPSVSPREAPNFSHASQQLTFRRLEARFLGY